MFDSTNKIHKSVVIEGEVTIGTNNVIGPNVVITGKINIGNNNIIGPGTTIVNYVEIGDKNNFIGNVFIGAQGEMGTKGDILMDDAIVKIGNQNIFREFITVNSPVRRKITSIGNNCYFMARSHIAHDCIIHNYVTMAQATLAGGITIFDHTFVGLGSVSHQWINIGESVMIAMQAANTRDLPPFSIVSGIPSKLLKFNRVGAERRGFSKDELDETDQNFEAIILGNYHSDNYIVKTIHSFLEKFPKHLKKFVK
jgi:UDP-N-acetylglucosamine acyltransferase